jgi:hypothetical protein
MTDEEFNIKYLAYLETGYYGLQIGSPRVAEFLDNIFIDLIKIPGFKYHQVKTKFSFPRFYTNLGSRFLSGVIEEEIGRLLLQDKI